MIQEILVAITLISLASSSNITVARETNQDSSSKDSWRALPHAGSNASTSCFPTSWNYLMKRKMLLTEQPNTCNQFEVLRCYCLTRESQVGNSSMPHMHFGHCWYSCFQTKPAMEYYEVNILDEQPDNGICFPFNCTGILCSQCIDGYGPPAYSFSLKCVQCSNGTLWSRIAFYILVAYGPLTVFLGVIVVFTVSVNSAPLHGWILVCQIVSAALIMRCFIAVEEFHPHYGFSPYVQIFGSLYGIWNLDFFRSVYKSFCLHPGLTTLQVMSLDYIIAAYPLVIIVVMYALVDLYSRDCWPVVIMWRPFHYCFTRFRHQLDMRTSLVDALGTFFSLS